MPASMPTPPSRPDQTRPQLRPRLERVAPWVDLFFKISAGLAASIAVLRALF